MRFDVEHSHNQRSTYASEFELISAGAVDAISSIPLNRLRFARVLETVLNGPEQWGADIDRTFILRLESRGPWVLV